MTEPAEMDTPAEAPGVAVDPLKKMREPIPARLINKKPKPYDKNSQKQKCSECGGYHGLPAVHLDFAGHAAITERLLDADIEWNWKPLSFDEFGLPRFDRHGGLWMWLTVGGVTRLCYGDADGKQGGAAIKEAIGDALRNGSMRFGAGLELWHKGDLHEVQEQRGTEPAKRAQAKGRPAQQKAQSAPKDPVRQAKDDLLALLEKLGVKAEEAMDKFAQQGHGELKSSNDIQAINALSEHYQKLAAQ